MYHIFTNRLSWKPLFTPSEIQSDIMMYAQQSTELLKAMISSRKNSAIFLKYIQMISAVESSQQKSNEHKCTLQLTKLSNEYKNH